MLTPNTQTRLHTFHSFPFLSFKTSKQDYLISFNSFFFYSFPLYNIFHSILNEPLPLKKAYKKKLLLLDTSPTEAKSFVELSWNCKIMT